MAKVTQNRVFNTDGTIHKISSAVESVVGYLTDFDNLRNVQGKDKEGNLLFLEPNGDKKKPKITTTVTSEPFYPCRPRSGYTQYWNNDGYSNPISPENLTPQGIGKIMAKTIQVANMIIAQGGTDADEMKAVLAGLKAYEAIAADEVAKTQQTAAQTAIDTLTKANGGDAVAAKAKLDSFMSKQGIKAEIPAPSVTVAEAAEAAASADETPQDEPSGDIEETEAVDTEPTAVDAEMAVDENA